MTVFDVEVRIAFMTRSTVEKPRRLVQEKTTVAPIKTYRSALNYLNSLANYERMSADAYNSRKFNLTKTNKLLAALGNPHRGFRSAHVAGTKGKGSTCAMLAEMLRA